MFGRKTRWSSIGVAAVAALIALAVNAAWALGFQLGQTKEQLRLKYDVSVTDHHTGRVTVNVTIADQGRLKPITSVDLVVPSRDGTGYVDLSIPLAVREQGGKQMVTAHLLRDLAERGEIQFKTAGLDGKTEALSWYYYSIPLAPYFKAGEPKKE